MRDEAIEAEDKPMLEPGSVFATPLFSLSSFLPSSETEAVQIAASGSAVAGGDTASVLIRAIAAVSDEFPPAADAVIVAEAEAEAEPEDGGAAFATADTDATADGHDLIVAEEQETTETDGDNPAASSFTRLEVVQTGADGLETAEFVIITQAIPLWMDFIW